MQKQKAISGENVDFNIDTNYSAPLLWAWRHLTSKKYISYFSPEGIYYGFHSGTKVLK